MIIESAPDSEKEKYRIPTENKYVLTVEEAAEYTHIGINRIRKMLMEPRCSFVLYVGKKKLVKRKEFEKFIESRIEI